MTRNILFLAAVALSVNLYGCSSKSGSEPVATTTAETANHAGGGDSDKSLPGLAELSPEDRASAEQQQICPVSGEALGKMGAPVKIDVKGQPVWICCVHCKDEVMANTDKYLAKLKEAARKE